MQRKHRTPLQRVLRGALLPICLTALVGCGHLDMYDQMKYDPYEESAKIFSTENGGNGAASRELVPNTVIRGAALSTAPEQTGKDASGNFVASPISVNDNVVARGKDRYTIYCVPCHGELGNGKGVAASYFKKYPPTSFYDPRLVGEKDGYYFDVVTHGKNSEDGGMYSYASRVHVADRWAIIAYIRTLQANPPKGAIPPPTAAPTAPAQGGQAAPTGAPAPTAAPK